MNKKNCLKYALYGVIIVALAVSVLNKRNSAPIEEDTALAESNTALIVTDATDSLPAGVQPVEAAVQPIAKDGSYSSKDEVALYIHTYKMLPSNFITKSKAQQLGWSGGGLEEYAPGKSIGGDRFGNREGLLPAAKGRTYTECDIDTRGAKSRGAKRIVFSNDGLIYYTGDHYEHFELLYGTE